MRAESVCMSATAATADVDGNGAAVVRWFPGGLCVREAEGEGGGGAKGTLARRLLLRGLITPPAWTEPCGASQGELVWAWKGELSRPSAKGGASGSMPLGTTLDRSTRSLHLSDKGGEQGGQGGAQGQAGPHNRVYK